MSDFEDQQMRKQLVYAICKAAEINAMAASNAARIHQGSPIMFDEHDFERRREELRGIEIDVGHLR